MASWSWSRSTVHWHEQFILTLAFVVWLEGAFHLTEVARGVAIGLFLATLIRMFATRRTLQALASALGLAAACFATARPTTGWSVPLTHVIAAGLLLLTLVDGALRPWIARARNAAASRPDA